MVKTVIVNVVSTANLQQKLDLHELEQFKEILHDTRIYGGRVAYLKSAAMEGKARAKERRLLYSKARAYVKSYRIPGKEKLIW